MTKEAVMPEKLGFFTMLGAVWLIGLAMGSIAAGPLVLWHWAKDVPVDPRLPGYEILTAMKSIPFPIVDVFLGAIGVGMLVTFVCGIAKR